MYNFDSVANLIVVLLVVSIPLGLWKLFDIVVWLCNNVAVTIK